MFLLSSAVEPCLWHVLEMSVLSSVVSSNISDVSGMCMFSSAVLSSLSHVFEIFLLSSLLSSKLSDGSGMCLFSSIVLSCLFDVSQIYLLFSLVLFSLFISFHPSDVCVCFVLYCSTFSVRCVTNLSNLFIFINISFLVKYAFQSSSLIVICHHGLVVGYFSPSIFVKYSPVHISRIKLLTVKM